MEVTSRWLELLQKGMSDTETLEDYFNKMVALYEALRGNGHLMLERDSKLAVIKGGWHGLSSSWEGSGGLVGNYCHYSQGTGF